MDGRLNTAATRLLSYALLIASVAACVTLNSGTTPDGSSVALAGTPSLGPLHTKKPKRTHLVTAEPTTAPGATTAPTDTLPSTDTLPPTDTPPPTQPSATCCRTFQLPPIGGLPSLVLIDPGTNGRLDYTANPNYGEANLSAGFSPDPYSVGMTSGGTVDVSYLGSSCSGFATSAPDFRINFGGGGASLMRLYFISTSADTTLVINDPFGNFYCVDDSFGTVNPTIDFNNPAGGTYDVWVGSYAADALVSGTFYITENSGNHP